MRRWLLMHFWHYDIAKNASIGFSWVYPQSLTMKEGARIGSLTVAKGLETIAMGPFSRIGNLNWITGFPLRDKRHFAHCQHRAPQLVLKEHAALTNRHLIDCTDTVMIGAFATVAGFRSHILTHSIDLEACRQDCKPVSIGDYCFVGTACVVLGGAILPDHSILAAASLLNKPLINTYRLYGGVPVREIGEVAQGMAYFSRETGFIY